MNKVFLIDDSTTILMSMSAIMKRSGCEVETAEDGQAALDKLKSGYKPNLIITDVHMPRLNGLDLIREVRALSVHANTPIVVLTTESQQEKRDEARENGATGWMVKPASADKVKSVLDKLLPNRNAA